MNKVTQLASGLIDGRDLLQVVLINHARPGRPPVTQIIWPTRPTTVDARPIPEHGRNDHAVTGRGLGDVGRNQGVQAVTTAAAVLDQIRDALLAEAEQALARAEQYVHSEPQTSGRTDRPVDAGQYAATAATLMRLLAEASLRLANRKAYGS